MAEVACLMQLSCYRALARETERQAAWAVRKGRQTNLLSPLAPLPAAESGRTAVDAEAKQATSIIRDHPDWGWGKMEVLFYDVCNGKTYRNTRGILIVPRPHSLISHK